ncbi:MAG: Fe-S oxidoreductase [Candidatus Lokiarchaeota archaeon]|nr:Fe-S oxidoreductase [Candidatus Lokiarchaeota archaeon]
MNILLIEPKFPRPCKSKNHNDFLPIGLIKLASYHIRQGNAICIIRGEEKKENIQFEYKNGRINKDKEPHLILITSYFTYWSKYVRSSVKYYKTLFPNKKIIVGGIYASLMPDHCKKYTGCDEVYVGVYKEAENIKLSYKYLERHYGSIDYQIIHTSRGCIRRCEFCGVYRIEPKYTYKESINHEIIKKKIIFYDNNLLANPAIENILSELSYMKEKQKILWCEAQSGIDGRILLENPNYASLLKKAGFKDIRISWDGPLSDAPKIKKQLLLLEKAGYQLHRHIFVFMIYNWNIPFEEMEEKRIKCWEWKVQISDCRYRPLNQKYDRYNGQKYIIGQTGRDYHIHKSSGWTDENIRIFRRHIRRQNICVRLRINFYSNAIERAFLNKSVRNILIDIAKYYSIDNAETILKKLKIPYWFPENYNGNGYTLSEQQIFEEFEKFTHKRALKNGNVRTSSFKVWRNQIQKKVLTQLELL